MSEARDEKAFTEVRPSPAGHAATGAVLAVLGLAAGRAAIQLTSAARVPAAAAAGLLALIGALALIRSLPRILRRGPRVRLSELGITDHERFGGPIPWSEITGVSRKSAGGDELAVIELKDLPARLAQLSLWQRWRMRAEERGGRPPFSIEASAWTKHDFNHIVSFALLYHARYK